MKRTIAVTTFVLVGWTFEAHSAYDGPKTPIQGTLEITVQPGNRLRCLETLSIAAAREIQQRQRQWVTETRPLPRGFQQTVKFLADTHLTETPGSEQWPLYSYELTVVDGAVVAEYSAISSAIPQALHAALRSQLQANSKTIALHKTVASQDAAPHTDAEARKTGYLPMLRALDSSASVESWTGGAAFTGLANLRGREAVVSDTEESVRAIVRGQEVRVERNGHTLTDRQSGRLVQGQHQMKLISGSRETVRWVEATDCSIETLP